MLQLEHALCERRARRATPIFWGWVFVLLHRSPKPFDFGELDLTSAHPACDRNLASETWMPSSASTLMSSVAVGVGNPCQPRGPGLRLRTPRQSLAERICKHNSAGAGPRPMTRTCGSCSQLCVSFQGSLKHSICSV